MNVILFSQSERDPLSNSLIVLKDRRATHIKEILKLTNGSTLRVGEIDGNIGTAKLIDINDHEVTIELLELSTTPPEQSQIELILALPRPKSLKRMLRSIANLGIKSLHLIHSNRVDKSYWTAPALNSDVMKDSLISGLEIARDTVIPTVRLHKLFKPFVQDVAPTLIKTRAFVGTLHRNEINTPTPLRNVVGHSPTRIQIAIGPEGGFTEYETGLFNEAGFENLTLGNRVYSVETIVPLIQGHFRSIDFS